MAEKKGQIEYNNLKVYIAAILFTLIIGFSFLGVKSSTSIASPIQILTYRFNFAAIGGLVAFALKRSKTRIEGKPLKRLVMPVGFYLGFMILQALGLIFASSIESGIIFAIIPIFAKIIAYYYLKEKGNWKQNAFITVSITAVIVMFLFSISDFHGVNAWGLILLTLSSLSMALSNVFARGVREEFSPFEISFTISISGCLIFNMGYFLFEGALKGQKINYFMILNNWQFVVAMAFLGIFSTFISSLLMSYMLANMEAVKATIFGNLSTGISIVAGVFFLKEPLEFYHIICTCLIIIGVVGTSIYGNSKAKVQSEN